MAMEFKLPNLGENVEKGDVVSVLVQEGDSISKGQAVLELETDKATVEVPSSVAGTVRKIHVSEGDTVAVDTVILTIEEDSKAEQREAKREDESSPGPQADQAGEEEPQPETEAEPVAETSEEPEPEKQARPAREEEPKGKGEVVDFRDRRKSGEEAVSETMIPASPAVRRFAREIGVDLHRVSGTGPSGRISIEDVKAYSRESRDGAAGPGKVAPSFSLPDFSSYGPVEREKFSNIRRATARHMGTAWNLIPHVTQHDSADITTLEELRKQHGKRVEAEGGKLTVTAVALKILAVALKVFPDFNASLDMENEEIIFKKYFHLGVAVDTPRGLLVPVIRDVDRKSIVELAVELNEVAEKARQGKVSPDDLQGGCMTITNLGGIGGTLFTPIVNLPEVAILGISRASMQPVYRNDRFEPRQILPLSLSYDHRLIDGADAARFLRWVAQAFEDPFLISLQG